MTGTSPPFGIHCRDGDLFEGHEHSYVCCSLARRKVIFKCDIDMYRGLCAGAPFLLEATRNLFPA